MDSLYRVLLVINDNTIYGSTRFQKYGFLLYKQYEKELKKIKTTFPNLGFYNDWKAHYYGPYSEELEKDIKKCVSDRLIRKSSIITEKKQEMHMYTLTIKGRTKWRTMYDKIDEIAQIDKKIKNLQKTPYYTLIRQIYNAYPEYTTASRIANQLDD